ncbi:DUF4091 domain-containing protein [Paenibacillus marinisediminis]
MANKAGQWELILLSSLAKVFPDEELQDKAHEQGSTLLNEAYSFQLAYKAPYALKDLRVNVATDLEASFSSYAVGVVPSEYPIHAGHDDNLLRTTPGLYPDPLYTEQEGGSFLALPNQWRSIWITVKTDKRTEPGKHELKVQLISESQGLIGEKIFSLEVIAAALPEQTIIHTEWLHTDCIATYYQVPVFSEAYWTLVQAYIETAVEHGMNMILTPLFTPPLDTEVRGERPTVQLIEVEVSAPGQYSFSFDELDRWVDVCLAAGVKYIEFSHLFTQWGAKHAPKIVGWKEGELERLFGWDTDTTGEEYAHFLKQFLPELRAWIEAKGIVDHCYFHVSDEPILEHISFYEHAKRLLQEGLGEDILIIDALSDYDFYERGLVPTPIPSSDHIEPFLTHDVKPLWTYYCTGQYLDVSNRFYCMPSARARILGLQMYKYELQGFLHWGYNFWFSQYSRRPIDPYRTTDADRAFPSGDPYLVYPGKEGPVGSMRLALMREVMQDIRAMQLLEGLIGRDAVLELIEAGAEQPITFKQYPHEAAWLLQRREAINSAIKHILIS